MASNSSGLSDATVFVSLALMGVWMQRQKRWSLFFGATEGKYQLSTNLTASGTAASPGGTSGSTTPSATAPTCPAGKTATLVVPNGSTDISTGTWECV